jgi:hypothetical protein
MTQDLYGDKMFQENKNKILSEIKKIKNLKHTISTVISKQEVMGNFNFFLIDWVSIYSFADIESIFDIHPTKATQERMLACFGLFLAYAAKFNLLEGKQDNFDHCRVAKDLLNT